MRYATINVSGGGVSPIVAPERMCCILVYSFLLFVNGVANIDLEDSDGTILSGPYSVFAGGGNINTYSLRGNLRTESGKGLSIGLDADIQVGGHIVYDFIYEE